MGEDKKSVGITTKKKNVKPIRYKPYAPENKTLSKAEYVAKQDKEKARKVKLAALNAKLIAEDKEEAAKVDAKARADAKAKAEKKAKADAEKNK